MIRQATGHRRRTSRAPMLGFREFLMRDTEIVGATHQVHARVQRVQARSRVPAFTGQARQSLAEGPIQAFNKSRIEYASPTRDLEQLLCLIEQTVSHPAGDLHDPFFLRSLDHRSNVQLWPYL